MPPSMGGPTTAETIKWISGSIQEFTIATAESVLRREVGRGAFTASPIVVTDRAVGRSYTEVKPFGRIEFIQRPQYAEVVLYALDLLRQRSPVRTGRYVQSHMVLLNGAQITGDLRAGLSRAKPGDRVQIVNTQPYAKKIEGRKARSRGSGANRVKSIAVDGLSSQAPKGVYERVVLPLLVRRYSRSMFFDFKYVKLNSGLKAMGFTGGGRRTNAIAQTIMGNYKRTRVLRDVVYPALQFYIKPSGTLN